MIAFRLGAEDAPLIGAELGHPNPSTLTQTGNFSAWIKLMFNDAPTSARYLKTMSPAAAVAGRLAAIQARTRARHTRPRHQVENNISKFLS
jgi:hypothetical protein